MRGRHFYLISDQQGRSRRCSPPGELTSPISTLHSILCRATRCLDNDLVHLQEQAMSNYVSIDRTIFQTIDNDGIVTDTSYGFRIYDDHAACYDNFFTSLEELKALSPADLIERARELSDQAADMVDFAKMNGLPIFVDGQDANNQADATPDAVNQTV